ncbi:MAG: Rrf2 family transcriptional regulator [Candidatus Omnitrophica bacterium]|nr:Rrf2 family transcriptional regulator [Candidatus Omnitrophota bacterium]
MMIDLAVYGNGSFVFLKDAARRQEISEKYIGALASQLKTAGLIRATCGSHGGLALAKEASRITLADIIAAVEGPIFLNDGDEFIGHQRVEVENSFWERARGSVVHALGSFTLEAIAAEQKQRLEQVDYAI